VDATLRFHLHKNRPLAGPMTQSAAQLERDAETGEGSWMLVGSAKDAGAAAHAATSRRIDLLVERRGFSEVHAYLVYGVVINLLSSQVVNEPMFTDSAEMPKHVLPREKLF